MGPEEIRKTKTGSLPYFAPEIVKQDQHGEAVDVWCVGILLYEMFVLRTPFEEAEMTEINILVLLELSRKTKSSTLPSWILI